MKQENKQELYASPEVEVIEIKASRVMCQSPVTTGFSSLENEEGEW